LFAAFRLGEEARVGKLERLGVGVRGRQALIRVTGRLEGRVKVSEAALSAASRIVAPSRTIEEEG
jgi:hypothetical protein